MDVEPMFVCCHFIKFLGLGGKLGKKILQLFIELYITKNTISKGPFTT
jgi:hypothetical protein